MIYMCLLVKEFLLTLPKFGAHVTQYKCSVKRDL